MRRRHGPPVLTPHEHLRPLRGLRRRQRQGDRARLPATVAQHEMGGVASTRRRSHLDDRTQRCPERRDDMRPDVPKPAFLLAPRSTERATPRQDQPSPIPLPPAQPPLAATSASHDRTVASKRAVKKTTEATPASSTARDRGDRRHQREVAIGFSRRTCLPARAACSARTHCTDGGTEKATASTAANKASAAGQRPRRTPPPRRRPRPARSRPHTPTNSISSVEASAGACVIRASARSHARPKRNGAAMPHTLAPNAVSPRRGSGGAVRAGAA